MQHFNSPGRKDRAEVPNTQLTQRVQPAHTVVVLCETKRKVLAPWHSSTTHPLHPVPQMQISGTSVQTEALRALGNYMIPESCKAGCGTEDKIKSTLNRLQLIFLVVIFRRIRNEGFSMLRQLVMPPWSPTTTMPHVVISTERQRFL